MITVVITTWQAPFDQVVQEMATFDGDHAAQLARDWINAKAGKWWAENDGNLSEKEGSAKAFEPIGELGFDLARWELWNGETGFHAMIDKASAGRLLEVHFDLRPGVGVANGLGFARAPGGSR